MNLLGLALRNLRRRPIRTCLSILGVALAVGSALALIGLSRSIQNSMRDGMDEIGDDLVVMQKNASDIFGGFIPEQTVERIAMIPGVARVAGELVTFAPSGLDKSVLTLGWPDTSFLWKTIPLREGRVPTVGERHVAVVGDTAAASLGKKVGDELELIGETYRIVGIAGYTASVNRGLVLVPLVDLQEASYRPRQVTAVHVNIDHGSRRVDLKSLRAAIEALGNGGFTRGGNYRCGNERTQRAQRAGDGHSGTHARNRHIRGHRMERRANHDVDCDRGNAHVCDRLRPRRAIGFSRRIRLSFHTGHR
jgi:putative ABC transport system permease protein